MTEYESGFKTPATSLPDGTKGYSVLLSPVERGWRLVRELPLLEGFADLQDQGTLNIGGNQADKPEAAA